MSPVTRSIIVAGALLGYLQISQLSYFADLSFSSQGRGNQLGAIAQGVANLPPLAENHWGEIPNTALLPTIPTTIGGQPLDSYGGNARKREAVMNTWSGGVWANELETFFVTGGGHADGPISNIFAFPLSTLSWRIESPQASAYNLNDPLMGNDGLDTNPDGTPAAIHSWGGLGYLPNTSQIFRTRGDRWSKSGGPTSATWRWGPIGGGSWTALSPAPEAGEAIVLGWHAGYGVLLVHLSTRLWAFDPAAKSGAGSWTAVTQAAASFDLSGWGMADMTRNLVYFFSQRTWPDQVSIINITKPWPVSAAVGRPPTRRAYTGAKPPEWATGGWAVRRNGFFDTLRNTVVHWGGNRDIYSMNADPASPNYLSWTLNTGATGVDPGPGLKDPTYGADLFGHYGRFFHMKSRDLYGLFSYAAQNLHVYRPFDSQRPSPPPPPPPRTGNIPPTASMTSRLSGATLAGAITVSATASRPLTAVARDAAGDSRAARPIAVTAANATPPPAPPPSGLLPLKPGWTKVDAPHRGFGVRGGKHQQWAKNPDNGRWYEGGGDFDTDGGYGNSYVQTLWSVDLAAWLAGPSPNAGWVKEQPYCRTDGKIQPKHADHVGWTWDLEHKKFVILPGVFFGSSDMCPGETEANISDPLFILNRVMAFDPLTREWEVWPNTGNTQQDNRSFGSVYDAPRKRHVHFNADSNSDLRMFAYSPGAQPKMTGQWKAVSDRLRYATPQRHSQRMQLECELIAVDRVRWQVYAVDYLNKKFVRYDLATDKVAVLADPPVVTDQFGITFNSAVFSQRHDVVFFLPYPGNPTSTNTPTGLYAYHVSGPRAGTWETISLNTGLGYDAYGHMLFYDEEGDALIMFGGATGDFRESFVFFYRYTGNPP